MPVKSYFTCYEKYHNNRKNIWMFVDFRHHCLCSSITLQLWLGMTPSWKSLKGSEQCQDDCTGEKFVSKRAVPKIDRKQWGTKRDLDPFYVNSVLQNQTVLGTSGLCYENSFITKIWSPAFNLSIFTWISWHCYHNVFFNSFQCSFHHYKLR